MTDKEKAMKLANKYWPETAQYKNSYIILNTIKKLNAEPRQKQK